MTDRFTVVWSHDEAQVRTGMTDRWITVWLHDGAQVRTGLMQHLSDQWETTWMIAVRVDRSLSKVAGPRAIGNGGQVLFMLNELEAEGMVERRKGPFGLMQWRRVWPTSDSTYK